MPVKYRLRFFFDPGSGTCLWSGNDAARERYGYPINPQELPLPQETITEIEHIVAWYDQGINWEYPPDPGPWDEAEQKRFDMAARRLLETVRKQLGSNYDIIDEQHGRGAGS